MDKEEIEKAYAELTRGTDQPDVIYLLEPKCPSCKAPWDGIKDGCENCGWPLKARKVIPLG